jgi:hypothetical protein
MFLRFVRLSRILRALPAFSATVSAFGNTLPVLSRFGIVMFSVFYSFSLVGVEAFAGRLGADNAAVRASSYGKSGLYSVNFDSMPGAFLILFTLLVQGDWPMFMEAAVAATGSKATRLYFVATWAAIYVVTLNVGTAFVIETFAAQKAKIESRGRQAAEADASGGGRGVAAGAGAGAAPVSFWTSTASRPLGDGLRVNADGTRCNAAEASSVEDWRLLLRAAALRAPPRRAVDFAGLRFSRRLGLADAHAEIYKKELAARFAETYAENERPTASGFALGTAGLVLGGDAVQAQISIAPESPLRKSVRL